MVSNTPQPHFTPAKDPVAILQEAGWAPGPVWTGGKSSLHRDSILDRPAHSQSLYRLSHPAHNNNNNNNTSFLIKYKSRQLKQRHLSRYNEHGTAWTIQGSNPCRGKRFYPSPKLPDRLRGAPSLLFNGYWSSACKT